MTTSISPLLPEVKVCDNRAITTSVAVANYFQKRHDNVMEKIRTVISECDSEWRLLNFKETHYERENPNGGARISAPAFEMTRDAFSLIVMGFTGKKALQWKINYIKAFNQMEAKLQKRAPAASRQGNYAVITYFENGLPVACHPLMPGEVVMNPDSCLEHVIRSGYVVMPCDEAEKFTLGEIQKMIAIARQARDRWLQH